MYLILYPNFYLDTLLLIKAPAAAAAEIPSSAIHNIMLEESPVFGAAAPTLEPLSFSAIT